MAEEKEQRVVTEHDAGELASLVEERRHMGNDEAAAADALADTLVEASVVPDDRLPADRVAIHTRLVYVEETTGTQRSVTLVTPAEVDPGEGRISIFSPVGRALLGRRSGAAAAIDVPGGRALAIRILRVEGRGARAAA